MANLYAAPPGYHALDCPNERERNTLSCPHHGCDGFVFDDPLECIIHEVDWHSGPYECSQCSIAFAAQPALDRHAAASGHQQQWACRKESCEMYGMKFETHTQLLGHIIGSAAHQRRNDGALYDSAERTPDADTMTIDSLSDYPSEEDYMCLEACCHKYSHCFSTAAEYDRHAKTKAHEFALEEGWKLAGEDLTTEELEDKQEARRNWACDEGICPMFKKTFSTCQSYSHHIATKQHLQGPEVKTVKTREPKPPPGQCMARLCHKYLYTFATAANYNKHIHSTAHKRAEEQETQLGTPETPQRGLSMLGGLFSPITPTRGREMFTQTPTPSPGDARVEILQRENEELQRKVRMLEAELDDLKLQSPDKMEDSTISRDEELQDIIRKMCEESEES